MNKLWIAPILALMLGACDNPVPPDKKAYVGQWHEKNMVLRITQEGHVKYKRVNGNTTTSMDVPIKRFEGNNIEAGLGPMSATFVVSMPPYQDGDQWKMVVDGVELTRTAE
ncbi:MAG TPA: hypothetical protein VIF60_18870 [Burkholderiaceae bacterium]